MPSVVFDASTLVGALLKAGSVYRHVFEIITSAAYAERFKTTRRQSDEGWPRAE